MSGWTLAFELSNPTSGSVVAPLTSLAPLSVVAPMSLVAPLSRAECASSIALGRVEHPGTPHARAIVVDTEHVAPALPRSTEDDLFPAIDRLLRRNGLSPRDLGGEGGRIAEGERVDGCRSCMELTDKEVRHVARLARLRLTDEERELYRGQLGKILGYMEDLKKLDTSKTEPTSQVGGLTGVFREDVAEVFPHIEDILKLAPARRENYFKVPKVIE